MGRNIQRLGDTLIKRMQTTAKTNNTVSTELGTINDDLSLSPDSLMGASIPQGEYMIMSGSIQPGDRVLISWCENEPVITGAPSTITVTSDGKGNVTINF